MYSKQKRKRKARFVCKLFSKDALAGGQYRQIDADLSFEDELQADVGVGKTKDFRHMRSQFNSWSVRYPFTIKP